MTVYVKLGLAIAALALVFGAVLWVNGELEEMKASAKEEGRKEVRLEVAKRDNQALVAVQAHVELLKVQLQAREADHAKRMAELDRQKTREVANAEAAKERFVGDVVAGRIRLFDPGRKVDGAATAGGGDAAPSARSPASVGDGAGGGELSPAFAGFLASEAGRADKVVLKLQACQAIVNEDRKVCNE